MITLLLALAPAHAQNLVGHWVFDGATPTVDQAGNFDDLVVTGGTLTSEGLDLNEGDFARADGYTGPTLTSKTLVSTVRINDLVVRSGSVLTIVNSAETVFDAIVWAERQPFRWMAGSDFFRRTIDLANQADHTDTASFHTMAIVYDVSGASQTITVCRDGVAVGDAYTTTNIASFGTTSQALFGLRHGDRGVLDATIREARIYDGALTCATVPSATPPADCDPGQDTEVCEGAQTAFDAVEALAPGAIDEGGPVRLRPTTIRAKLQAMKDEAESEGCGADLVVQSVGATYGSNSITGEGDVGGGFAGSYGGGDLTGLFDDGTSVGEVFGSYRRGRWLADTDGAGDRALVGLFIRTSGPNGVAVGFELTCAVDPSQGLGPWYGAEVPPFN
ncbi:MAG: hypothetical protein H6734_23940 [Alphaproteobacteria bacterium]|nr:hypothetical protein [Alphaproteobacteria bacterium]